MTSLSDGGTAAAVAGGADPTRFRRALGVILLLGAVVRLAYVLTDDRGLIGGDGFAYHVEAHRLADGLGYTDPRGNEQAHHPPAWVTLLGIVSWLGGRDLLVHQLVGVAIGLALLVVVGLVGRRYLGARAGLWAAGLAAVYPGFWVLEAQVLSEPLGLLVLGLFTLLVHDLRRTPTLPLAVAAGATCGALALVRSEQLALLVLVVAPILLRARAVAPAVRWGRLAAAGAACALVLAPWTIYNLTRFDRPVLLSTNAGSTLLNGNCPPATLRGERLGYFDTSCNLAVAIANPGLDRSELDVRSRDAALENIGDNVDRLPKVVPARFGRALALYRPAQTVRLTAEWFQSERWPVWAWVAAYWLLLPLAVAGGLVAHSQRRFLLPLLGPVAIVVVLVAAVLGEPRYHSPADLTVVVLAGAALASVGRGSAPAEAPG